MMHRLEKHNVLKSFIKYKMKNGNPHEPYDHHLSQVC